MTVESTSAVQVAAIFAIVIVIVVEIKLGRDYSTWAPVLTAIVGYALPGPVQWSNQRRKSDSLIHMDPEFADKDISPAKSKLQKAVNFVSVVWPSVLLLAATTIWVGVNPSKTTSAAVAAAEGVEPSSECATARAAAASYDCQQHSRDICAKRNGSEINIFMFNSSVPLSEAAWSNLMFFSVPAAKRINNEDCEHRMPLTYGDNFVRACKNKIELHWNGHAHLFNKTNWSRLMRVAFLEQAIVLACPLI